MTFSSVQDKGVGGLPVPLRPNGNFAVILLALAATEILAGGWLVFAGFTALALVIALIAMAGIAMAKGDSDMILVGWIFLYPLGYYLLSYPRDRPVFQFDRLLIFCLLVGILAAPKHRIRKIPDDLKRSAIAWFFFLAVTCISFLMAKNALTVGRLIVDSLLLPAILGFYIVRQFRLRGHEKWLHAAICTISIYCAVIGLVEIVQQRDLMAFEASENYLLFDPSDPTAFTFLRPNGPFRSDSTFAIAGLISFFLLAFLWTQIRDSAGPWRRILHYIGVFAALLQANLPVFRSIFIALIVVAIIDVFWTTGMRRALRLAALGVIPVVIIAIGILFPSILQDRASSENISGRWSQERQTWRIFIDHPVFGVGLSNFLQEATTHPRYQADLHNDPPLNYPHNNLGWIAAETGILGLVPYVLSQILLVVAFRRLDKRGKRGQTAWRYFVFIFLSYWITGMVETSAYFDEMNMWFLFAVALLYRYGIGETPEGEQLALPIAEGAAE
jgi:hypothetical protein